MTQFGRVSVGNMSSVKASVIDIISTMHVLHMQRRQCSQLAINGFSMISRKIDFISVHLLMSILITTFCTTHFDNFSQININT